mmetsp:Transcript_32277/g.68709  ORF Transcript_32277/g.68709 Transcript_32277/m.68709 type:complete len:487 (+) Transcript_32277:169-1629(+)
MLRGMARESPKRTCWADVVSDEEEESDPSCGSWVLPRENVTNRSVEGGSGECSKSTAASAASRASTAEWGSDGNSTDGTGDVDIVGQWASELDVLVGQLKALVARSPQALAQPSSQSSSGTSLAIETTISAADIERWQALWQALRQAQARSAQVETEVAEAAAAGGTVAAAEAQAQASIKALKAAERKRFRATGASRAASLAQHRLCQAALTELTRNLEDARADAAQIVKMSFRDASASERVLGKLRKEVAKQSRKADKALAEFEHIQIIIEQGQHLSEFQEQLSKVEARKAAVETECDQLRRTAEGMRAELEAPTSAKGKAEALAEKVVRLELECRELQGDGDASPKANMVANAELSEAQESNRRLVGDVKDARIARDEASTQEEEMEAEVESARKAYQTTYNKRWAMLNNTAAKHRAEIAAQAEVESLRREISNLEVERAHREAVLRSRYEELEASRRGAEDCRAALAAEDEAWADEGDAALRA